MPLREKCARAADDIEKTWARLSLQHSKLTAENQYYRSFIRIFDLPTCDEFKLLSGPLHGSSFALKDNISVAGFPVSGGCRPEILKRADNSAALVDQLRNLGSLALGSTNLDELCLSHTGDNRFYGRVMHPLDAQLSVLGSSGGSAVAVARGQVDFALGTDFGGSIRLPAAACGLCGLKMSPSLGPRQGILFLSDSLDAAGFFTRQADDLLYLFEALGHIPNQQFTLEDFTLLVPSENQLSTAEPAVLNSFEKVVATLRDFMRVESFDFPLSFEDILVTRKIIAIEHAVKAVNELHIKEEALSDSAKAILIFLKNLSPTDRAAAACRHQEILLALEKILIPNTAILTPTLPTRIPKWNSEKEVLDKQAALNIYLTLANLCELPAISLPVPLEGEQLPFSIHLMGRPRMDVELVTLSALLHQELLRSAQ